MGIPANDNLTSIHPGQPLCNHDKNGPKTYLSVKDILFAMALVVAVFLVYYPAWQGGWIWDDEYHVSPPAIRSWHGLWRIWFDVGATMQYYPLTYSIFWTEHKLWGEAFLGYHLVNISLHALAAVLVWRVLKTLAIPGAWLAAAIFALHPVQVESVAWIQELKNILSAVFYLSAALLYLRFDQNRKPTLYAGALVLFILMLLSKTAWVTFPAAMLVVFWWQRGRLSLRRDIVPLLPFFLIGIASGLLTMHVEKFSGAQGADFSFSLMQRCLLAGRAFWFYLGKLLWPAHLYMFYPRWQCNVANVGQWVFPVAAIGLLAGLVWLANRWRSPIAAVLFFSITLFPVLGFFNVYYFTYSFVNDRFQYLPSLGIIAVISAGATWLIQRLGQRHNTIGKAACAAVLLLLSYLTMQQCRMYADNEILYRATLAQNFDCWLAHCNLGKILQDRGDIKDAISEYRLALVAKPDYAMAHNNLGFAFHSLGQIDEAIGEYQKAIQCDPYLVEGLLNLGLALADRGQQDKAIAIYHRILAIDPGNYNAHNNIGLALATLGKFDEAIAEYRIALTLKDDLVIAHINLGMAYADQGHFEQAIVEYRKALAFDPSSFKAMNNIGAALAGMKRYEQAIGEYKKALDIKSDYLLALSNLGEALSILGRTDESIVCYRRILDINPNSEGVHTKLASILARQGRIDEALNHYQRAAEIYPRSAEIHYQMARLLIIRRNYDQAILQGRSALEINPGNIEYHTALAIALAARGEIDEAILHFRKAAELQPSNVEVARNLSTALTQKEQKIKLLAQHRQAIIEHPHDVRLLNDTAWILATNPNASFRNGQEALALVQQALHFSDGQNPYILDTLAAAYAETGHYSDAVLTARKAHELAKQGNQAALMQQIQERIKVYESGKAFREYPSTEH